MLIKWIKNLKGVSREDDSQYNIDLGYSNII